MGIHSEESSLLTFHSAPDRLQVLLQRASYDAESSSTVKLNHRFEFPRLLDLKYYLRENLDVRTTILEARSVLDELLLRWPLIVSLSAICAWRERLVL